MPAHVISAARSPWAPRGGALARMAPEKLLATVIEATVARGALAPRNIDRVLVACDTGVGAQALNIARRAVSELGWVAMPALTVDGQGVGDLAAVDLAARTAGVTLVAALDVTSLVPPGAGLVRDYGRPALGEPSTVWLETLATEAGLNREQLDATATRLRAHMSATGAPLVPIRMGAHDVITDSGAPEEPMPDGFSPLVGERGLLTAYHQAPLADGAAAIVVETTDSSAGAGRHITHHRFEAGDTTSLMTRLSAAADRGLVALADSSAVIHHLVGPADTLATPSVLALGSTPSTNGLRILVDMFHTSDAACRVVGRGQGGQIAFVELAARSGPPQPYSET